LQSLCFISSRGVVHRGITLSNILFRKNGDFRTLVLVDFGLARVLESDATTKDFCGSLGYIAPEIYQGERYRFEVDMFAFGVVLFRLLSGVRPFPSNNSQILKRDTIMLQYNVQGSDWENVSAAAKDLVRKLLINRQERLTAEHALQHPWFSEVDAVGIHLSHTSPAAILPSAPIFSPSFNGRNGWACEQFYDIGEQVRVCAGSTAIPSE
jgi:calcium/calmodulin-dependent protein kinase I